MKYKYHFGTGSEEIEVDEEWFEVLKDMDRLEDNHEARQRYSTKLHYDAFEFVPEFMAKEDEVLSSMFDGSPAFEYAIEHLIPKHREILYRRAVNGEMFKDIGKSYDVSANAIHEYYKKICVRFKKFYEEGLWLYSSKNASTPQAKKVTKIPFGLTPAQVMAIRAYRSQLHSIHKIAEMLDVPINRVKCCLRYNPILETICPACGKPIAQIGYGRLQKFCDTNCYMDWFRRYGMDPDCEMKLNGKERITKHQQMILDYYRQNHFSLPLMRKITGISEQYISSYCYSNPLPYTICYYCGTQIPGEKGKRTLKYCSVTCRNRYHQNLKKIRRRNGGSVSQRLYPTHDQLKYALELHDAHFSFKKIMRLAGLTQRDIEDLFRYEQVK